MKYIFFLILVFPILSSAFTEEKTYIKTLDHAKSFLSWLEEHKNDFAACEPKKIENNIRLCDGTEIEIKDIRKLFKLKPGELIDYIKMQNIKLEILCKNDRGETFKSWCSTTINRNFFKEVSSLHGQYIPNENTIALYSDSNFGSLIHEYLHYRQFQNNNKIYSHIYKKERIQTQNEIIKSFDLLIADVQQFEKEKKTAEAKALLKYAGEFSDLLMKFGFWQKLIDERNLFLSFIKFRKELGVPDEDVQLAEKNMTFLCHDKALSALLSKSECPR